MSRYRVTCSSSQLQLYHRVTSCGLNGFAHTRGFGGVYLFTRHLVDHLRRGTPIENTGRDYLRNIEIEDAIYRAHETGRRVELGLQ